MKIVVVDTNILFSALLSKSSKIRATLDRTDLQFYTPNFLITEIFRHKEKILKFTNASETEVYEFLNKALQKVHFVNEELISLGNFVHAYRLCHDIDEKDTPFVALTFELEGELWTGDTELKRGLFRKGFRAFFDDSE